MNTEQALRKETNKWLHRIEKEIKDIEPPDKSGKEFLENILAYIKDSRYFLGKGDLVRSFEAVIWAWSYLSISRELKLLKTINKKIGKGD